MDLTTNKYNNDILFVLRCADRWNADNSQKWSNNSSKMAVFGAWEYVFLIFAEDSKRAQKVQIANVGPRKLEMNLNELFPFV